MSGAKNVSGAKNMGGGSCNILLADSTAMWTIATPASLAKLDLLLEVQMEKWDRVSVRYGSPHLTQACD